MQNARDENSIKSNCASIRNSKGFYFVNFYSRNIFMGEIFSNKIGLLTCKKIGVYIF